jgi:hypothetical protein
MKQIFVKVSGSESEPVEITITTDTTAGEILSALNLEDYVLTSPRVSTGRRFSEGKSYHTSEVLYRIVGDGHHFIAKTSEEYWGEIWEQTLSSKLRLIELIDKYPQFFQKPS